VFKLGVKVKFIENCISMVGSFLIKTHEKTFIAGHGARDRCL